MSKTIKAVVAFAGARDGYQLPLALREADLLEALVTDLYWPSDKEWFSASLGQLLPERWRSARFCPGLDSRVVNISVRAMATSACQYMAPPLKLSRVGDRSIGRKAGAIAERNDAALVCYSYYASEAFRRSGDVIKHRFLFQLHPHPRTVRRILEEEIERAPQAKASLLTEPELSLPQSDFESLSSEPHLANGWLVASSYTAQTLSEHGIAANQIRVVPYGVDGNTFAKRVRPPAANRPFTIVYVGSLIQRKGLTYLLDAVGQLGSRKVRVLLCGRGFVDARLLRHYPDLNLEIEIGLPRQELIRRIHEADVFVLPSLVEGFAHVILEAMSSGLPVIATSHTCAPDVMTDGQHGFIVPIRNTEAIAERLAWGMDHRADLAAMGEAAAGQARQFTWKRFRQGVRDAYIKMIASIE